MSVPRVLLLADQCNPQWPSLPIVAYKYALALEKYCDLRIVTQVRNRPNIEAAGMMLDRFDFVDTEYVAAPISKLSVFLRGGTEVAWSTSSIMAYLPYLEFERQVWKRYRADLRQGRYDIVHRITPMSPTLPSYIAGRGGVPFILGPLNGNLSWPQAFISEQRRERERLRVVRKLYKSLPFIRRTYRNAACVMAAFSHTVEDISWTPKERIVAFPEIGFDPDVFLRDRPRAPFAGPGPFQFMFAGRLVPYKVPEVAVRAFVSSEKLRPHVLRIIGDGPERPRLEAIVAEAGAKDRIIFEGRMAQAEVARALRESDAFIFPSIRELGAGVVVEAMASGALCIVTDYGAPGVLVGSNRGVALPLQSLEGLTAACRTAMEACLERPEMHAALAARGCDYAWADFPWDIKARRTLDIYKAVLTRTPLQGLELYD